jgi:hypothetical protein
VHGKVEGRVLSRQRLNASDAEVFRECQEVALMNSEICHPDYVMRQDWGVFDRLDVSKDDGAV